MDMDAALGAGTGMADTGIADMGIVDTGIADTDMAATVDMDTMAVTLPARNWRLKPKVERTRS